MAKRKPATPPASPAHPIQSDDLTAIWLEVDRWKSRCAELLDSLQEIDDVGYISTSQIAHEALIRFVHNTRK